ncbi:MAG TPA: hypothetical protein VIM85_02050 [Pseudomonadales bacterium]
MEIVLRAIAISLTIGFAYLGSGFSSFVDPEEFDISTIIFFFLFGATLQAGLFLSTIKIGKKYKLGTSGLMLPCAVLLFASCYESISRYISGNPISSISATVYFIGLFSYLYAYVNLFRVRQNAI